jgi:acetyl esterase/lipase
VIKPLSDSTRALQFMRFHANQLNVDRNRVILMGGSAGAGTSLFIAFNDEMADPQSDDPVEHHSTRVTAAIAIATQATYDIGKWRTVVFEEWDVDLIGLAAILGLEQSLLDFYGITEVEDFDSPAILEYRERVDMLDMMDATDPPFYVDNPKDPATFPITVDLAFHHAFHAVVLTERADEVGIDYVAYVRALEIEDPSGEDDVEFALRHFGI